MLQRKAKEERTGKKTRGKEPKAPKPGPQDRDQVNLTDKESRIMPISGGGFEQCYNAQASVDVETMLVVGNHVTQNPNDKKEIKPAIEDINALPEVLGTVDTLLADTGYFSEANVTTCLENEVVPCICTKRDKHNRTFDERFSEPDPLPDDADDVTRMKHLLQTRKGRELYAKRKSTVEPVFGIIKAAMGFRQFLLRGVDAVSGEWDLVCLAWDLKRMHALAG